MKSQLRKCLLWTTSHYLERILTLNIQPHPVLQILFWGCDQRPEKQQILPHVGILRFHSPKSKKDVLSWARAINRDQFKVTKSTKVCSNHFVQGYQTPECPTPTLYMRGYDSSKTKRPAPKVRPTENKEKKSRKRKRK